jgi:hypothetical protein
MLSLTTSACFSIAALRFARITVKPPGARGHRV